MKEKKLKNLLSVRPGYGISPKYYDEIIGKKLKVDVNPHPSEI